MKEEGLHNEKESSHHITKHEMSMHPTPLRSLDVPSQRMSSVSNSLRNHRRRKRSSSNDRCEGEQKSIKYELDLLKKIESNRRRKAQKERQLDEDRDATIEKLLSRNKGKTSMTKSSLTTPSDQPSDDHRTVSCSTSHLPSIRYQSTSSGNFVLFPKEMIPEHSIDWFQSILQSQ
jgi:hypothetical protein